MQNAHRHFHGHGHNWFNANNNFSGDNLSPIINIGLDQVFSRSLLLLVWSFQSFIQKRRVHASINRTLKITWWELPREQDLLFSLLVAKSKKYILVFVSKHEIFKTNSWGKKALKHCQDLAFLENISFRELSLSQLKEKNLFLIFKHKAERKAILFSVEKWNSPYLLDISEYVCFRNENSLTWSAVPEFFILLIFLCVSYFDVSWRIWVWVKVTWYEENRGKEPLGSLHPPSYPSPITLLCNITIVPQKIGPLPNRGDRT